MTVTGDPTPRGDEPELLTARIAAIALLTSVGVAMVVGWVLRDRVTASVPALAGPAALAGLVALPIAYRVYHAVRGRRRGAHRRAAFMRGTIAALAITEGVALFGVVAYLLSENPMSLFGVASHVLLTGAIWPSASRLEVFLASDESTVDRAGGASE
jgi:hypothetical protein